MEYVRACALPSTFTVILIILILERCMKINAFTSYPVHTSSPGLPSNVLSLLLKYPRRTLSTCPEPFSSLSIVCSSALINTNTPLTLVAAGETVFYNSNILHCATYDSKAPRATLHACMGDCRGGSTRARNILQHGLEWMTSTTFCDTLDARGKAMLSRLLDLHKISGGNVGYSLDG